MPRDEFAHKWQAYVLLDERLSSHNSFSNSRDSNGFAQNTPANSLSALASEPAIRRQRGRGNTASRFQLLRGVQSAIRATDGSLTKCRNALTFASTSTLAPLG